MEPQRILKIFVRHLSLIVSSTAFVLYKHLFEHYYHPCDKENRVFARHFALRTLLLSLVATDVGVGLLVQPLYISTLVNRLKEKRIDCIYDKALSVVINFFCTSSFVNVVTISVDRF